MSTTKHDTRMAALWNSSLMNGSNVHYVEALYERYLSAPSDVPEEWRRYFDALGHDSSSKGDVALSMIREQFRQQTNAPSSSHSARAAAPSTRDIALRATALCDAYRRYGHQCSALDPLKRQERPRPQALDEAAFTPDELAAISPEHGITLQALRERLTHIYCSTVGAEFMTLDNLQQRQWMQERVEARLDQTVSSQQRQRIVQQLIAADGFEQFLANRYPGAKRFGLEGCESLLPLLHTLITQAAADQVNTIVLGMAHRGRLNVMANVLGRPVRALLAEFEGDHAPHSGSGDVKYHMGYDAHVDTAYGAMHLSLLPNPSHLEIVAPVVEGAVRAHQCIQQDAARRRVVPVIMHGDAAFAGQGVVMETFQLSRARAFETGGTVHIVVNNQVGFTTSRKEDARSTPYCTDIARMLQIPVLHINADDPEAVVWAAQTAIAFRQAFGEDIVIDLVGFRRRGHNEADEPSGTQPLMYAQIKQHPGICTRYAEALMNDGLLTHSQFKQAREDYRSRIEQGDGLVDLADAPRAKADVAHPVMKTYETACSVQQLSELAQRLNTLPDTMVLQRQVARVYADRLRMAEGTLPANWGFAELLAYASVLDAGHGVRLVGQDSGRGTFSHRHAVVHDQKAGTSWVPLQHMAPVQPSMELFDSLLSEEAVMAFEYGYSVASPQTLVLWEAQFGDFANGAQVVIDQFIASGETKWGQRSALTLLLPHGFEGQGPEHSSARLERFLQLCAEHNMRVCTPTTPAQMYHLLRCQALSGVRKPLVVMQPKSLLRHREAVSSLAALAEGGFERVIGETQALAPEQVQRIVLTSGKVYYDLTAYRAEYERTDTAIIRLEELYPFPTAALVTAMDAFPQASSVVWCQEEPLNQGGWQYMRDELQHALDGSALTHACRIEPVGRPVAAAPACGDPRVHARQQQAVITAAFGD